MTDKRISQQEVEGIYNMLYPSKEEVAYKLAYKLDVWVNYLLWMLCSLAFMYFTYYFNVKFQVFFGVMALYFNSQGDWMSLRTRLPRPFNFKREDNPPV